MADWRRSSPRWKRFRITAPVREEHKNEYARRVRAGGFRNSWDKLDNLYRFRAALSETEAFWKRL